MRNVLLIVMLGASVAFAESDPRPVLVVSGMTQESQIAAGPGVVTVAGGADPANLRKLLSQYSAATVRAVVSFGISGALEPSRNPGDVLVGSQIKSMQETWMTSTNINSFLTATMRKNYVWPKPAILLGIDGQAGVDPAGRAALHAATGAASVDNESHIAAEFAAANGLPFSAVRVISDGYWLTLPPAALLPLLPTGAPDMNAILKSLEQDPWQLAAFIETGIDAEIAFAALSKARESIDFRLMPGAPPAGVPVATKN